MDGLLDEMPAHVFAEWMAYYRLEPFGEEVLDTHLANVTTILINQNRGKNAKAKKPEELRLWRQVKEIFDPLGFYERLKEFVNR